MRSEEAAAAAPRPGGFAHRLLSRVVDVRPDEVAPLLLAAAYFFLVLASWYVLRPIRDEMGVAGGVDNLAWLFTGTLAVTLLAQPLFGAVVARWPRRRFIPWVYRFFALNLLAFYGVVALADGPAAVWVGRVFFVWTTTFSLFVVSVFWAMAADVFRPDQGRRLFGFIAAGGTLGGLVGGALTAGLAERIGSAPLLLVAALLLEGAVQCVRALGRSAADRLPGQARLEGERIGGGALAGIRLVAASPYLLGVCLFLLFYTLGSTFLYFLQAKIVEDAFADRDARTAFFARVDVVVNALTLLLQTGVTGRVLARLGVGRTLVVLPLLSVAGFAALAVAPTVALVVAFQVARRTCNFAFARPARENLFVPVPREHKYKAKVFGDTVVYRFGDQVGAWANTGLIALGLGTAGLAGAALPLAAIWVAIALWLGSRYRRLVALPLADTSTANPDVHDRRSP
jgi:AAA family ATP:ADP antiporter